MENGENVFVTQKVDQKLISLSSKGLIRKRPQTRFSNEQRKPTRCVQEKNGGGLVLKGWGEILSDVLLSEKE